MQKSNRRLIFADDGLQTPLATSSPRRSVRRNADGNDTDLERFFVNYDPELDLEDELRLMMNSKNLFCPIPTPTYY